MTEAERPESQVRLALWSDDPARTDLLSFDAVATTVADALLDDLLDPIALGLSGSWGSGKTTVLNLVSKELDTRSVEGRKILVVATDPWRYDPKTGAKESLMQEVLAALAKEIEATASLSDETENLLRRLGKRIHWAKALKLATTTAVTLQLPSVEQLMGLVKPLEEGSEEAMGLEEFRLEFQALVASQELEHLRGVVVLIDDLDRCLPETVVDTLEALRLFLAVPKMSFVIAADEERVADAIRTRFAATGKNDADADEVEEPARLYLHKIVQTVIPVPALSRYDTQTFLLLLLASARATEPQFVDLTAKVAQVRLAGGDVENIEPVDDFDFVEDLAVASRLTPLLYEKLNGNPRRIKRFLNDLNVRQTIAARRGIKLDPAVIAKLMILEVLMPTDFKLVLAWLSQGVLRDQLELLEVEVGRPPTEDDQPAVAGADVAPALSKAATKGSTKSGARASPSPKATANAPDGIFSQALLRWAKLPPSVRNVELSSYLTLAASFAGTALVDEGLSEQLRDIATSLLSDSRAAQSAVTDEDLDGLNEGHSKDLLMHLGRAMRDQPTKQKSACTAILRISRRKPQLASDAAEALLMLPPSEISLATPLLFQVADAREIRSVLNRWQTRVPDGPVKKSVENALAQENKA